MSDVVEIAKKRRDALAVEIADLDAFVSMAEKLLEDAEFDAEEDHDTPMLNLFGGPKG